MPAAHRVLDPQNGRQVPTNMCALAVMTKAPRAGKVKTRLQPPLTAEEAAELNTCFLRDTAAAIAKASEAGLAHGVGVYTPVGAEDAYEDVLPREFYLVPQRGDAFGGRLTHATADLLQLGFAAACLIDSDSPTVPVQAYAEAAEVLARPGDRVVLGPSDDGGYYLIGMKQVHSRLFEDIDWSTERVLPQTIDRANEARVELHMLPTWYDVDDRATLHRLCDELLGSDDTKRAHGFAAPETKNYLAALIAREGRERIWSSHHD